MAGRKLVPSMATMAVAAWISSLPALGAAGETGTSVTRAAADKCAPNLGPPAVKELMEMVRGSAVPGQAVQREAPRMGLGPNKLPAPPRHVLGLKSVELAQAPPNLPSRCVGLGQRSIAYLSPASSDSDLAFQRVY